MFICRNWFLGPHPLLLIERYWQRCKADDEITLLGATKDLCEVTECTDPRDRVYGLAGIVSELRGLPADYTTTTAAVYMQATKYIFATSSRLDLLNILKNRASSRKKQTSETENIPSWCPKFNDNLSEPSLFEISEGQKYTASGSSKYKPSVNQTEGNVMVLEGYRRDYIVDVADPTRWIYDFYEFLRLLDFIEPLAMTTDKNRSSEGTSAMQDTLVEDCVSEAQAEFSMETLRRTMIADDIRALLPDLSTPDDISNFQVFLTISCSSSLSRMCREEASKALFRYRQKLDNLSRYDRSAGAILPPVRELARAHNLDEPQPPDNTVDGNGDGFLERFTYQQTAQDVIHLLSSRPPSKLFRTARFRLGLGLERVSKGDQVWLLAGGRTPYILRQRPDKKYGLLGAAYVDGIMYGESWPQARSDLCEVLLE